MLSLAQLRTAVTRAEAEVWVVDNLADMGFNAKAWQSDTWQFAIVKLIALLYATISTVAVTIATIGFGSLAENGILTEFSDSVYDNQRVEATRSRHQVRLTSNASGGPYSIAIGKVVVQETSTGTGLLFTNVDNGEGYPLTLSASSTLDIVVECQTKGSNGNVAIGAISKLVSNFAGVSVVNIDVGDGTSLITAGGEAETDDALKERNTAKWGSLSWATPASGFEFYAREGEANVTRVKVNDGNPRGPGTVDVYVAGATGVLTGPSSSSGTDAADALAEIAKKHAGTPNPDVIAAAADAQAFVANVYVSSQYFTGGSIQTTKSDEIEQALTDYVNGLPIGGTVLPPPDGDGVVGYMLASEWKGAVTAVSGVENIAGATPSSPVALSAYDVATVGSIAFTYIAI